MRPGEEDIGVRPIITARTAAFRVAMPQRTAGVDGWKGPRDFAPKRLTVSARRFPWWRERASASATASRFLHRSRR
jgi:hypothetical protein